MELRSRGVADEEINTALCDLDEEQEIATATEILKKYMRGKENDVATLQKAFRYLMGKGFSYEVVKAALSACGEIEEE